MVLAPVITVRQVDHLPCLSNADIAAQLYLSEGTVRNYVSSIFAKLEVENRAQAIVRARDAGFGRQHRP